MISIGVINITGGAYIAVQLPDGSPAFTLSRSFYINPAGKLVTAQNYPVSDYLHTGAFIEFPAPLWRPVAITSTGEVSMLIENSWTVVGQIAVALFEHPELLFNLGDGYYAATVNSGSPTTGAAGNGGG